MGERELFLQALDIDNSVDRAAFLDPACAGQPDLRSALEELLKAHKLTGQFLDPPHSPAGSSTLPVRMHRTKR